MAANLIDFTSPSGKTFDSSKVQFSGGVCSLLLNDNTGQVFTEDFTDGTGFTYNASLTEFSAGLIQQKDQTAANSVMAVNYSNGASVNLNWHKSGGSLTGGLNGGPSVTAGKLVCTGTQGVYYTRASNTIETHKFKYTPNYTTTPPANINLFSVYNGTNDNDRFQW